MHRIWMTEMVTSTCGEGEDTYRDLDIVLELGDAIGAFEGDGARCDKEVLVATRVALECWRERSTQMSICA